MVLLIRFFVTWNHYMLKSVIFQLWKYFWRCTLLYQYQVSYFNFFLVTKIWRYTVIEGILHTQSYFLPNITSIIFVNKMWLFCWFNISMYSMTSSVQFSRSVMSDSLWPHELQHTRPPCPSPTHGVHPNSCPLSRWCHPAVSYSVIPFSSCPQSLPASEFFSNESTLLIQWTKYWSFSFSIIPSKEHPGLISFRMDWWDLLAVQGTLKSLLQHHSSKASILWCSLSSQCNSHIHTWPPEKP